MEQKHTGRYKRYTATCDECDFNTHDYLCAETAIAFAEQHAMKTGHIVNIIEV